MKNNNKPNPQEIQENLRSFIGTTQCWKRNYLIIKGKEAKNLPLKEGNKFFSVLNPKLQSEDIFCNIESLSIFENEVLVCLSPSYIESYKTLEMVKDISKIYPNLSFTLLFDFNEKGKNEQIIFKKGGYKSTNIYKLYSLMYVLIISIILFSPEIFN